MSQPAGALSISATGNTPKQVKEAVEKAGERWLKNPEVIDILQNYEKYEFKVSNEPPVQPPGGSIFLFDRKQVRFFRKDGHNWRKKPDGKTVRETHEKLKVDNQDVLNCYYAHAEEQEDNFQLQRRCYWLLEGESDLVLVHYLNVPAEALRTRSDQHGSTELADDANASGMHQMSINDVPGAMPRYGMMDPNDWHDSGRANRNMPMMYSNMPANTGGSSGMQGPQSWAQDNALSRRQDPMEGYNWQQGHHASGTGMDGVGNMVGNVMPTMNYGSYSPAAPNDWQYQGQGQAPFNFSGHHGQQYPVNMSGHQSAGGMMPGYHNPPHGRNSNDYGGMSHGYSGHQMTGVGIDHSHMHGWQGDVRGASSSMDPNPQQHGQQRTSPQSYDYWPVLPQDNMQGMQAMPQGSPAPQQSQPQRGKMGQMDPHHASWFEIVDFSPSWDYTSGGSKILLTGTPDGLADMQLFAMFGSTEVPAVRLQPGVLRFQAPSHAPGPVALCLTTGEGKVCSGNVEFNYELPVKDPPSNLISSITTETSNRDLQVRLVTRLLKQTGGSVTGEDGESAAEVGKGEHSNLVDAAMARVSNLDSASAERVLLLLLERELKIFSQQVIGQHGLEGPMAPNPLNAVDDEGMGLIHIVAALGYDWAVELLLQSNADVQLRDPWGLTPLHWAAAKGHENTIAVLLRYGANGNAVSYTLGAVNGFTPADLASMHSHSGIAAYLSETHLAQGLSKLQLSDDRSSLRKRNRNRPVNMSQSNDTAAEEEVHLISSAARKAAEKIYLAMESGKSPVLKVDQAIAHGTQQEIGMNIAAAAPDLDLAVNRVEAIVHNQGARMQYMKMREAADRNQVSVVAGACDEVEQTSQ